MSSLQQVHGLTKLFFKEILTGGDLAIDATVGNGYDTAALYEILHPLKGGLIGFDIQEEAITEARKKIPESFNMRWILDSHATFDRYPEITNVALFVYNLGYLPKGDKGLTTMTTSTIESVQKALYLLRRGGGISITCYRGHLEGKKEIEALEELCKGLDPYFYVATWTHWINRKDCPSVLLIRKLRA